MKSKLSLRYALQAMGLQTAFKKGQADFSGINGNDSLFMDEVYHQTIIEVNERGCMAAAATGATNVAYSVGLPTFRCEDFNLDCSFLAYLFYEGDSRDELELLIQAAVYEPPENP